VQLAETVFLLIASTSSRCNSLAFSLFYCFFLSFRHTHTVKACPCLVGHPHDLIAARMGICVTHPISAASDAGAVLSSRRSGAPLPKGSFKRKSSYTTAPALAPSTPAADSHESMSSDKPFSGYDYHVWSVVQQNAVDSGQLAQKAQRSSSIAVLQRISMQRLSVAAEKVALMEDFKVGRSGERRASTRCSIGGRARGLSASFNEIYSQLQNIAPQQGNEEKAAYLKRIFSLMDTNKKGSLSRSQLAASLLNDANRASVDVMMAAADHDKDGYLNENEFVSFFIHVEDGDACLQADQNDALLSSSYHTDSSDEVSSNKLAGDSMQVLDVLSAARAKRSSVKMRGVEVTNLPSQSSRIKCIALSQDGELYAVAHRHDSIAHVYTLDGVEVRRLVGHQESLLGITFSADRKHVVTAARDNFLVSWDRTVGLECSFFEHPGIVTAVAVSWDGKYLYSGCQDNLLRKITSSKAKLRAVLPEIPCGAPGVIVAVGAQHTKNEVIAFSRSCDQWAYICSAQNLQLVAQLSGHESLVWQTSFNADDSLLLTCCELKVILWNSTSFASLRVFSSATVAAAYSPAEEVLWTTAVFGGKDYHSVLLCFNSCGQMHMLSCDDESGESLIDLQLRSSVYTASNFVGDTMVCGDDNGNVYRIRIT
jgi:WD40 repeat protein